MFFNCPKIRHQFLWLFFYRLICSRQIWIYIVDDNSYDMGKMLEDKKKHCSTAHKRLDIGEFVVI